MLTMAPVQQVRTMQQVYMRMMPGVCNFTLSWTERVRHSYFNVSNRQGSMHLFMRAPVSVVPLGLLL